MIEIRRATEANAHTLAQIGASTFVEAFAKDNRPEDIEMYVHEAFGFNQQLAEIRDPKRIIEIAWIENQAVGYLHLRKGEAEPSVQGPKPIELLRFYVDARWHGKSLARLLMDRTIEIAKSEGAETLWLGVWERNFRAQAFYAKYDFVAVGSHIFRVGTDDQTDIILARCLRSSSKDSFSKPV